jgi:hypothetical protein
MTEPYIIKKYLWKNKFIGQLMSDGTLEKSVNSKIHQLYKPAAWCIDKEMIEDAVKRGCKLIRLLNQDRGVLWLISPEHFLKYCWEVDRGYDPQLACPLKWWAVVSLNKLEPSEPAPTLATQKKLF